MIDIHSHILPGIDDGAASLEESLIMADMAVQSGVKVMAATPHCNQPGVFRNYESAEQKDLYRKVKDALAAEKIPLQLLRGMEIFTTRDVPEKMAQKKVIALNGSRYYLMEFGFNSEPQYIEENLRRVIGLGKVPIIAHPERYYCVQDDPNYLYHWRMQGALAQLNKGSVLGRFGDYAGRTAEVLLQHCLVNCIASDAHGADMRTTGMQEIKSYLDRHFSEDASELLMYTNPKHILQNKVLPERAAPIAVSRKKSWFW